MSKSRDDTHSDDSEASPPGRPSEGRPSDSLESTRNLDPTGPDTFRDPAEHGSPTKFRKLGKYVIRELIGLGGMGVVWKAFDPDLQRTVAIKVLAAHLAHSPTSRRRFQREGRAAAAISHPNVVTVHAVEEHGDVSYLVMEYVSGGSLKEYVKKCRKLDPVEVIRLSCQIAEGLAAAHAQGVIHRDVKPGNVMLQEGATRAKLTDFGLARVVFDNADLSSQDQFLGSPAYTSPEQIRGPKVDARADLFSLGCVVYYMLIGQSPWHGHTQAETIHKIATADAPRLRALDPNIPQALSDIVERLLRKNPEERYQSAAEVAAVLRRFLLQLNQTTSDEIPGVLRRQRLETATGRKWPPSRIAAGWAGVLLVMVAGLAAAFVWPGPGLLPRPTPPAAAKPSESANPDVSAVPLPKLSSIVVGPQSDADFHTIGEAISRAAENCTITVTGPGPYAEAVRLAGASLRGLKLQARPRAVWQGGGLSSACLSISDVADVTVEGFDFEVHQEAGRAVAVTEAIDSLSIVDCGFRHMLPAHRVSLVLIGSRPGKTEEQVRIERCRFYVAQGPVMGISVGGSANGEARLHCADCLFSSPHVHVFVAQTCRRLSLARNVFLGGDNGINFSFKSWLPDCRIEIVNNTFVGTRYWISLMDSFRGGQFPSPPTDCRVCNNLILGGERVLGGADQWEPVLSAWKFAGNCWELDASTKRNASYYDRIAAYFGKLDVPVRNDPNDPRFLVPAANSPLATAGVGGDLPVYVGAKRPAAAAP